MMDAEIVSLAIICIAAVWGTLKLLFLIAEEKERQHRESEIAWLREGK